MSGTNTDKRHKLYNLNADDWLFVITCLLCYTACVVNTNASKFDTSLSV